MDLYCNAAAVVNTQSNCIIANEPLRTKGKQQRPRQLLEKIYEIRHRKIFETLSKQAFFLRIKLEMARSVIGFKIQ